MTRTLLLLAAAACTASSEEVAPPRFDPYYPTGLALSADERYLFVLNANSDLRWDSGTLQVLDVAEIAALRAQAATGQTPEGCRVDAALPGAFTCPTSQEGTAARFVLPNATVKVGNFGAGLGLMPLVQSDGSASSRIRLFASVRGDPSLTWADFDSATGTIDCGAEGEFPRCEDTHRLDRLQNDPSLDPLPEEPFYLYVDGAAERVFVTHLKNGSVTLATAPRVEGSAPVLADRIGGLFAVDSRFQAHAVGVAPRLAGAREGPVYVTSTTDSRVVTLHVADGERFVRGDAFSLGDVGDGRGIAFSGDGGRAFVVSRLPASLAVYDTSLDERGQPRNELVGSVEVCSQPSQVALWDAGGEARAYVPCFGSGEVWVIDPVRLTLLAAPDTGRGPSGVVAAPTQGLVFVAHYAEDTIGVLDAVLASATENHMILRLGEPRRAVPE